MTELLLRIFIRDRDSLDAPRAHAAIGTLAGIVGIVCNVLLFAGKLAVGLIASSVSIIADAMNNLSDASSSVIALLGFRMAQRPADRNHPYGHARYEYLSGLIVAFLILLIGAELARSSAGKIIHPGKVEITDIALWVMAVSMLVKIWMSLFFRKLGKRIHSTTLLATSADSRNDVIATGAVLFGCGVNRIFGVNMDGWIGLVVALFILYSGYGIARETISPLIGRRVDDELLKGIEEMILCHEGILGIHDLLVHDYGPGRYFASVHVELSADEDPQICHDIIDHIECDALKELNVHLVIHYDPVSVDDAELNEMRGIVEGIICGIDPQLSMHDFRMIRSSGRSKLTFDLAVPYGMQDRHGDLKAQIDAGLRELGKDYKTVIRFDGA